MKNVSPRTFRRAFTFIELLLVVVLLSIMAVMAVPDLNRMYQGFILQQCVDDMAYLMRYAQSRAVAKALPLRFNFDAQSSTYWLTEAAARTGNEPEGESFGPISGSLGRIYTVPSEVRVDAARAVIGFSPDGRIEKGTLTVCQKNDCRIISTEEQAGYVEVLLKP